MSRLIAIGSPPMGGIGFNIGIERCAGEDALPLFVFHRHVWKLLDAEIRSAVRPQSHRSTFADYYGHSIYEGLGDVNDKTTDQGEWGHDETGLGFSFDDGGGNCSMSMYAMQHWILLAYATLAQVGKLDAPGWSVPSLGRGAVERRLVLSDATFGYTTDGMWKVYRRLPGKPLDEEDTAGLGDGKGVDWSDLVPELDPDDPDDEPYLDDRHALEWVALTAQCACAYCISRRPSTPRDIVAARAAWDLLDGGEQRTLEEQVAAAVRAWDWTDFAEPPELVVLGDWLMERGANMPRLALAAMVNHRVRR